MTKWQYTKLYLQLLWQWLTKEKEFKFSIESWRWFKFKKLNDYERHAMMGDTLKRQKEVVAGKQKVCNHRKGGMIGGSAYGGGHYERGIGTDSSYAIFRHQFAHGDTWVRCLRCGKWWKPGDVDYAEAMKWPTNNAPSGGIQFRGNLEKARELTKES